METKEINSQNWERFCRQLQEIRPRTRLTIERLEPGGHRVAVIHDLELRDASFDRNAACINVIHLDMADAHGETVEYAISEPIHIKLRQRDSDRYNEIEIIAEDGTHLISARPGFRQDLLGDLLTARVGSAAGS